MSTFRVCVGGEGGCLSFGVAISNFGRLSLVSSLCKGFCCELAFGAKSGLKWARDLRAEAFECPKIFTKGSRKDLVRNL